MKGRKILCCHCKNLLLIVRKPGWATVEIICPFCGEIGIVSLKVGERDRKYNE